MLRPVSGRRSLNKPVRNYSLMPLYFSEWMTPLSCSGQCFTINSWPKFAHTRSLIVCPFVLQCSFILFLNKKDLFEQKLKYVPLQKFYPPFEGTVFGKIDQSAALFPSLLFLRLPQEYDHWGPLRRGRWIHQETIPWSQPICIHIPILQNSLGQRPWQQSAHLHARHKCHGHKKYW